MHYCIILKTEIDHRLAFNLKIVNNPQSTILKIDVRLRGEKNYC